MRDDCVSCDCTDESRRYLPSSGIEEYVIVASLPMTYTTYTGVAEIPVTGENTTIACAAYAGAATRTGLDTNEAN